MRKYPHPLEWWHRLSFWTHQTQERVQYSQCQLGRLPQTHNSRMLKQLPRADLT